MNEENQLLQRAVLLHQKGDLASAVGIYRHVLEKHSNNAEALHLLGMAYYQAGELEIARDHIQKAIASSPNRPHYHVNLAVICHQLDELETAKKACRTALALQPKNPEAYNNLGAILLAENQNEEAERNLKQAIKLKPDYANALTNLGLLYLSQQKWEAAVDAFHKGLKLDPNHAEGQKGMADALCNLNRYKEALDYAERAVYLQPENTESLYNLGRIHLKLKTYPAARAAFEKLVALAPNQSEGHCGVGLAMFRDRLRNESAPHFRKALELNPRLAIAWNHLGLVSMSEGDLDEAMFFLERCLEVSPTDFAARFNRGCITLLRGDLEKAWPDYLAMRDTEEYNPSAIPNEVWRGESVPDKTILIRCEQGAGDHIQFIRYAKLVKERAKSVILECPASLVPLMKTAADVDRVILRGQSYPKDALQTSLMDLPGIFKTSIQTIPLHIPYLNPTQDLAPELQKLLTEAKGMKVGICWQGNPRHVDDDRRSMPAKHFEQLRDIPGISWFSLQKNFGAEQLADLQKSMQVQDLSPMLHDFTDTARVIQQLDLVLSIDSALCHLTGALGKPVWLMNSFVSEWRWMEKRSDSPWYPSMKIFRQPAKADWAGMMQQIRQELSSHPALSKSR